MQSSLASWVYQCLRSRRTLLPCRNSLAAESSFLEKRPGKLLRLAKYSPWLSTNWIWLRLLLSQSCITSAQSEPWNEMLSRFLIILVFTMIGFDGIFFAGQHVRPTQRVRMCNHKRACSSNDHFRECMVRRSIPLQEEGIHEVDLQHYEHPEGGYIPFRTDASRPIRLSGSVD